MAAIMSVDNFNRIAEDINRESRVMLNILNMYEDTVHLTHKVSLKEILTDRIIPYVEAVDSTCEVRFAMTSRIEPVNGSYVTVSRALINIVANALDAIRETGRRGLIEFELAQHNDHVNLTITDNGSGIPADRLRLGPDRVPLFVGHTTKGPHEGEGIGTRQIYAAFGPDNIRVESETGRFTRWSITLGRSVTREDALHTDLGTRYVRFIKFTQQIGVTPQSTRSEIAAFIWQLRKMELFSYDLIYHFSRYNNVRDVFLAVLLYRYGGGSFDSLKEEVRKCRLDDPSIGSWLLGLTRRISRNEAWQSGQSSSIRAGIMALPAATGACIFLLADQPQVTRAVIAGLSNSYVSYLATPEEYAVQSYEGACTQFGQDELPARAGMIYLFPILSSKGGRRLSQTRCALISLMASMVTEPVSQPSL